MRGLNGKSVAGAVAVPPVFSNFRDFAAKLMPDDNGVLRNVRRHAYDSIKKLEKDKEVGEDEAKGADKRLDALTKKYVDLIDVELKHKEAELLEV